MKNNKVQLLQFCEDVTGLLSDIGTEMTANKLTGHDTVSTEFYL
jgi:hypothetical protein